jgi:WD40 repeat protein
MEADLAVAIVKLAIAPQHLSRIQELVLKLSWDKLSYPNMAEQEGYQYEYIKGMGSGLWKMLTERLNRPVNKRNIHQVVAEIERERQSKLESDLPNDYICAFYGRETERDRLTTWIVAERCRLVAVLGLGGMGKTTLALHISQALEAEFQSSSWRTLLNAPPLTELLLDIIGSIQTQLGIRSMSPPIPDNCHDRIDLLLGICQQYRCQIILDNYESILQGGVQTGQYRAGYEDYGRLLHEFGQGEPHQSCLLLTSREKPMEVGRMEGVTLPVRALNLGGLTASAGQQIFSDRGCPEISIDRWDEIDRYYGGNPLALQIVAAAVMELGGGDIGEIFHYLQSSQMGFPDLNMLLQTQWERMTAAEHQVMYWLAVSRQSMTTADLDRNLQPTWNYAPAIDGKITPAVSLLSVLQSLCRRSAIEQFDRSWCLQPVWIEYVTAKFVAAVSEEFYHCQPRILDTHAIAQASAPEYIRQSQLRTIVQPIVDSLLKAFGDRCKIRAQIQLLLDLWRQQNARQQGYLAGNLVNLAIALKIELNGLDFSKLTIQEAYLVESRLVDVDFTRAHFDNCAFTQIFSTVLAIAYSADGSTLAASDNSGQVQLWRIRDRQCLITCDGHTAWVRQLCFSPDGKYLASAADDRTIRIWDITDGTCLQTIGAGKVSFGVSYSADGKYITSGSVEGAVYVWDAATGVVECELLGHTDWVINVCFHPREHKLVSGSGDGTARIWDLKTRTCEGILPGHDAWVTAANYSADGNSIVTAALSGEVRVWNVSQLNCQRLLAGNGSEIWSAKFSPDGRIVATAGADATICLWRVRDGQCIHYLTGHLKQIWSLAFHPNGKFIASAGDDRSIRVWELSSQKCLQAINGHLNWVRFVAWTHDGEEFLTASWDSALHLWNRHSATEVVRLEGHTKSTTAVACDSIGQTWASGSEDRTIRIWDAINRRCQRILRGHTEPIWGLAYSPDARYLVSGSVDRTVRLWEVASGKCLQIWSGHGDRIDRVAFHPDRPWVASASEDGTVKVWEIDRAEPLQTLAGYTNRAIAVSFHPHGKYLASGGMDSQIPIWDLDTGKIAIELTGGKGWILDLSYSPDGQTLVVARADATIEIWDTASYSLIHTLTGHTNWVRSVAISPCNRYLVSTSNDETARLWEIKTGQLISIHRPQQPYAQMKISGATGISPATIENLRLLGAIF